MSDDINSELERAKRALAESRARNLEAEATRAEGESVFARLAKHRETNHWAEKTRLAWRGQP